jgi:multiple sugar transport system permease protein
MVQNIFTTAPTFMIMFLAALQDINPALYEAASIDGANGWQQLRKITLPLLRPIILMVIVLGTIGTLQIFDQVYLATSGGPLGTTMTPVFMIFSEALGTQGSSSTKGGFRWQLQPGLQRPMLPRRRKPNRPAITSA